MHELSGRFLGRGQLRLVARLGAGAMGVVYEAEQPRLQRRVAVKVLWPHLTQEPGLVERFHREARIAARLDHPHILPVYGFGEDDGLLYLVIRLVRGGSLKDRIRAERRRRAGWTGMEALELARQALPALDYAHRRGVIHRDLKPDNFLLEPSDDYAAGYRAFLSDFGIAQLAQAEDTELALTVTGAPPGTPAYMAPEQVLDRPLDGRADLYAFGVVLFELLAGRLPFQGQTPLATALQHVQRPLPSARGFNPRLSTEVEVVLSQALAKEPEARFPNGAALLAAFAAAVEIPASGRRPWAPTAPGAAEVPEPTAPDQAVRSAVTPSTPAAAEVAGDPSPPATPGSDPSSPVGDEPGASGRPDGNPVEPWAADVGVAAEGRVNVETRAEPVDGAPGRLAGAPSAPGPAPGREAEARSGPPHPPTNRRVQESRDGRSRQARGVADTGANKRPRRTARATLLVLVGLALVGVGLGLRLATGSISGPVEPLVGLLSRPTTAPTAGVPTAEDETSVPTAPPDPYPWVLTAPDLGASWQLNQESTAGSSTNVAEYEADYVNSSPDPVQSLGISLFSTTNKAAADAGLGQLRQAAEARGASFAAYPGARDGQPWLRGRIALNDGTARVSVIHLFRVGAVVAAVEAVGPDDQEPAVTDRADRAASLQRDRLLSNTPESS